MKSVLEYLEKTEAKYSSKIAVIEENNNITYLVNNYNNKEYGGMFYGEISSTSRLSVNG